MRRTAKDEGPSKRESCIGCLRCRGHHTANLRIFESDPESRSHNTEKGRPEMKEIGMQLKKSNRRTFLQRGVTATAAATAAGMVIPGKLFAENDDHEDGRLTRGDIAILRF